MRGKVQLLNQSLLPRLPAVAWPSVAALAAASEITRLPRDNFEVHEISKAEFEDCIPDKQQNSLAQRSQRGEAATIRMRKNQIRRFVR